MGSVLFSPLQLRGVTLRNRIVVAPMQQYCATGGHVDDWHLVHLSRLAAGGPGIVFMESTKVEPRGCTTALDPGLWSDDFIPALQRIASSIRKYGSVPGIQLGHAGRKGRRSAPWEGRATLPPSTGVDGKPWELIGPSAIAHGGGPAVPREMTAADIETVLAAWRDAARRAHEAGFEALEILGGHGYLVHQFLSAASNRRTDASGGSLEGRMRFAVDVARSIRRAWPDSKPLFFRASVVDECGWTPEDSVALARKLRDSGVDVIDCSSGGMAEAVSSETPATYGYQVPLARHVREGAGIQTMAVGLIVHADQAEDILRSGSADLVALGREFLHNPNWPLDAAQKLGVEDAFALVPRVHAYFLEKRARNKAVQPSTWRHALDPARRGDVSDS